MNTRSFLRTWLTAPLCTMALLSGAVLATPADPCTPDGEAITEAAYTNKPLQLEHYAQACSGYHKSYALYRLAQLRLGRVPMADNLLLVNQGIVNLERGKASAEQGKVSRDGESKILLAALYNLKMGLVTTQAEQWMPKFDQLLAEALQDPAAAPRALLIKGIHLFFVPVEFGGGSAAATTVLQQAVVAFEQQQGAAVQKWGQAEAHLWLGQAYAAGGDRAGAKNMYQRALELAPGYTHAQYLLGELTER